MRSKLHDCVLMFDPYFLRRVHLSLLSVARPEGAFRVDDIEMSDSSDHLLSQLKQNATREKCENCGSNCYLYCGACGGRRTPLADKLLPPRIDLQVFDVLIVLHWQERITSSTGITAAVMALEGQVKVAYWPKTARDRTQLLAAYPTDQTQREMEKVLQEIDCDTDFLLFPGPGSTDATQVDWNLNYRTTPFHLEIHTENSKTMAANNANSANLPPTPPRKRRLIVIESNWQSGKTVYNGLIAGLQAVHGVEKAAKLRCLSLSNVVGKFWKFQAVGHSAVSTIEAIHHAAIIARKLMQQPDIAAQQRDCAIKLVNDTSMEILMKADVEAVPATREQLGHNREGGEVEERAELALGKNDDAAAAEYDGLLILFRLQRNRLLKEMRRADRGLPRAMRVSGSGVGDWAVVLEAHSLNLRGQVE